MNLDVPPFMLHLPPGESPQHTQGYLAHKKPVGKVMNLVAAAAEEDLRALEVEVVRLPPHARPEEPTTPKVNLRKAWYKSDNFRRFLLKPGTNLARWR